MENELGVYTEPPEYTDTTEFPELNSDACQPLMKPPNPVGPPAVNTGIKPQDRLAASLAIAVYSETPIEEAGGFMLYGYTTHTAVWTMGQTAIVAFRGTAADKKGGLRDIIDDFDIAFGRGCDLEIRKEGQDILNELTVGGFTRFILTGHSLGGRAAMCLATFPGVVNIVALNPGAPILNPASASAPIGTVYHIFGDIISTHVYGMEVVRIMARHRSQPDWLDPFYHATERFLAGETWTFITAQQEQEELEQFFLKREREKLTMLNLATSFFTLNWFMKIKGQICSVPVPGAQVTVSTCDRENFVSTIEKIAAALAFGAIGIIGGPVGVAAGVATGLGVAGGSLDPVLDQFIPGFSLLSAAAKEDIKRVLKNTRTPKEFVYKLKKVANKA